MKSFSQEYESRLKDLAAAFVELDRLADSVRASRPDHAERLDRISWELKERRVELRERKLGRRYDPQAGRHALDERRSFFARRQEYIDALDRDRHALVSPESAQ